MENREETAVIMERFSNLPPEIQASYVSEETVMSTEEALYRASLEINDRMEEIMSLSRNEAHSLRQQIMDRYLEESVNQY